MDEKRSLWNMWYKLWPLRWLESSESCLIYIIRSLSYCVAPIWVPLLLFWTRITLSSKANANISTSWRRWRVLVQEVSLRLDWRCFSTETGSKRELSEAGSSLVAISSSTFVYLGSTKTLIYSSSRRTQKKLSLSGFLRSWRKLVYRRYHWACFRHWFVV